MDVKLEDAGPCRKVLHVNAAGKAVMPEYEKIVQSYAQVAKLPGFRKGKAPGKVVERRFHREIAEDTKDRLVPRFYRAALAEQDVVPVAIVSVEDVVFDKEKGLEFKVTIDVAPDFKLPKYKRVALKRNQVEVSEPEVDDAFGRMVDNFSRFEDITGRPVKEGDLVLVDYRGECGGKAVSELAPGCAGIGEGKDFWALAGEPEFLPGLAKALTGMNVNDSRDITVQFPADHHVAEMAGKEAAYHVDVKGLRERVKPEMDAEFLKRFDVETESALREKLRGELLESAERSEQDRLKEEIGKFLLKKTEFELPQAIVEQEVNIMARSLVERIARQGATREQIIEQREAIVNSATESSKERVKLSYILSRIADEEGIGVDDAELDSRIETLGQQYGMPAERFRAELEKRNGVEGLKNDIRSGKTMDFLLENAKIKG